MKTKYVERFCPNNSRSPCTGGLATWPSPRTSTRPVRHRGSRRVSPDIQQIDPSRGTGNSIADSRSYSFSTCASRCEWCPALSATLLERKAIAPQREFRPIDPPCKGNVGLGRELHGPATQGCRGIGDGPASLRHRVPAGDLPMDRDRCLCVVVENPPVGEQQAPDMQFE